MCAGAPTPGVNVRILKSIRQPESTGHHAAPEASTMLNTVIILLIVLWALGLLSAYTLGGFIHLLLIVALAIIVVRLIQGRGV